MAKRVGDLEVEEDLPFQQAEWRIERIGWVVMALVILAGLLGLLGSGPLSSAQAGGSDAGIEVQYDRFMRVEAARQLEIRLLPGSPAGGEARVMLDGDYVQRLHIERIQPEPNDTEVRSGGITYTFRVGDLNEPGVVVLSVKPMQMGLLRGRIGLDQREPVSLSHVVYP
jgi:hypothetical protein